MARHRFMMSWLLCLLVLTLVVKLCCACHDDAGKSITMWILVNLGSIPQQYFRVHSHLMPLLEKQLLFIVVGMELI